MNRIPWSKEINNFHSILTKIYAEHGPWYGNTNGILYI